MAIAERPPVVEKTDWSKNIWFRLPLPNQIISNTDLAAKFRQDKVTTKSGNPIDEEWIFNHTGIEKRYLKKDSPHLALHESAIAARNTLEQKGWEKENLDLIAVITSFPVGQNLAAAVKDRLKLKANILEVNAACSGFTVFLNYLKENEAQFLDKKILVVTTEQYSPYLHDFDQAIFSDFTIGLAFQYGKELKILESNLIRQPDEGGLIHMPQPYKHPDDSQVLSYSVPPTPKDKEHHFGRFFEMQGPEVLHWASSKVPPAIEALIEKAGLDQKEIKMIIPHQANQRITKYLQKHFSIPVYDNIKDHGNTSSASIPLALAEAINEGKIQSGDKIVLAGFGAGLLICTNLVQIL